MLVPFQQWLPDQPAHMNPGALVATNVIPRAKSYGPLPALSETGDALAARCKGLFFVRDNFNQLHAIAGTASGLYRTTGGAWEDASKSGGYALPATDFWGLANYGERLIAASLSDNLQSLVLGSDTDFSDLSSTAPRAKRVAAVGDFVMVGNTWDSADGYRPWRVWWSGINAPGTWPTIGSTDAAAVQSDRQDLLAGDGGAVQAIVPGLAAATAAIIQERAVWQATYVGSPLVFTFNKIEGARGTKAPGSVAQVGSVCYYLADDGFVVFDGSVVQRIGVGRVDQFFFSDLVSTAYLYLVQSCVDQQNGCVIWAYPSVSTTYCDRALIYSYVTDRWAYAEFDSEVLASGGQFGVTVEELDALAATLDAFTDSFDDPKYVRGDPKPVAVSTNHKVAYFSGSNLAATIETGEFARDDGYRIIVEGIRPIVDGGTVSTSLVWRDTPQASVTVNTATTVGADGVCPQRQSCRYARARVSVAAGGTWSHASAVEPQMAPEGLR